METPALPMQIGYDFIVYCYKAVFGIIQRK